MIKEDIEFLLQHNMWVTVYPFNNGMGENGGKIGFANDIYYNINNTEATFPMQSFSRNMIFSSSHLIHVFDTPEEAWNDAIKELKEQYKDDEANKNYNFVDLGLSVKWAKCNIGATSEEEYGEHLNFDNARKYFKNREDRLPSRDEFEELLNGTTQEVVEVNGIKGTKFTSKTNGNYIFVPFAGYGNGGSLSGVGYYSYLWSSSVSDSDYAWYLYCDSNGYRYMNFNYRYIECSVRGVSDK